MTAVGIVIAIAEGLEKRGISMESMDLLPGVVEHTLNLSVVEGFKYKEKCDEQAREIERLNAECERRRITNIGLVLTCESLREQLAAAIPELLCPDSPDGNHHAGKIGSDEDINPTHYSPRAPCWFCGTKPVLFEDVKSAKRVSEILGDLARKEVAEGTYDRVPLDLSDESPAESAPAPTLEELQEIQQRTWFDAMQRGSAMKDMSADCIRAVVERSGGRIAE